MRHIVQFSGQVQAAGGWLSPITKHYAQYNYWKSLIAPFHIGSAPATALLYPAFYMKIPLFLAGTALLAWKRDLRGLAVASLPLTVFVFAYSQGKSVAYYLPEVMIYFTGIALVLWFVLENAAKLMTARFAQPIAAFLFMAGACWGTRPAIRSMGPH